MTLDLVVVGGGIVGATAAYRAARAGASVALVDHRHAGRATDAGAGIVSPETDLRDQTPTHLLSAAAQRFYPELLGLLHADGITETGYAPCGKLVVATTDQEAEWIGGYLAALQDPTTASAPAPPGTLHEISTDDARRRFPALGELTGAFWSQTAGRVEARTLETALRAAGRTHGLVEHHALVADIVVRDGSARGVRLGDGTEVAASAVVIAGGAWSTALAHTLECDLGVVPQRGQIAHLGLDDLDGEPPVGSWPVVAPLAHHYLLAFPGRVVAGATRESGAGFAPDLTAAGVHQVLGDALRVAPGLARARVLDLRVGLRPVAERGYPVLGALPDVGGVWVATGHGASGLTLGPWSGWAVAAAALGVETAAELDAFSPVPSR